jgi:hypothetical protein
MEAGVNCAFRDFRCGLQDATLGLCISTDTYEDAFLFIPHDYIESIFSENLTSILRPPRRSWSIIKCSQSGTPAGGCKRGEVILLLVPDDSL